MTVVLDRIHEATGTEAPPGGISPNYHQGRVDQVTTTMFNRAQNHTFAPASWNFYIPRHDGLRAKALVPELMKVDTSEARAAVALRCLPARRVTLWTDKHEGSWKRSENLTDAPSVNAVFAAVSKQGLVRGPAPQAEMKLMDYEADPNIAVLVTREPLVAAYQMGVNLHAGRQPAGKANRQVCIWRERAYVVHLPALMDRLDKLSLLDRADVTGAIPVGGEVDEFLALKLYGQDSGILAPATTSLVLEQRFSEPC